MRNYVCIHTYSDLHSAWRRKGGTGFDFGGGQRLDHRLVVSEDRPVEVWINGFATIQPYLTAHSQNTTHLVGSVISADKWGPLAIPALLLGLPPVPR